MKTLTTKQLEATGGSAQWYKLSESKGVKLFNRGTPVERINREANLTELAASTGVGPKVYGVEQFWCKGHKRTGLVLERIRGIRGLDALWQKTYDRRVRASMAKLEAVGIKVFDDSPSNVIISGGIARIIDYGPFLNLWPVKGVPHEGQGDKGKDPG